MASVQQKILIIITSSSSFNQKFLQGTQDQSYTASPPLGTQLRRKMTEWQLQDMQKEKHSKVSNKCGKRKDCFA